MFASEMGVSPVAYNQAGDFGLTMNEHNSRVEFDPGYKRPYIDKNGRIAVTVNRGRWTTDRGERVPLKEHVTYSELIANGVHPPLMVNNATALRKEEWIQLDQVVLRAARFRLRAWADLAAANTFGGFNGMSKAILEHEVMSDPGTAIVDMDALTDGRSDAPAFQLRGLPLPITHSDFWFSSRKLAMSRNTGTPIDTTMGEAAGRRIAESVEKTLIGNNTGMTYGGASTYVGGYDIASTVWGYTNYPYRLTYKSVVAPSSGSWTASRTLANVLAMRDLMYANQFYGPFMLYTSNDWDQYLDNDYILTGGNVATQTLRARLKAIEGIQDVRRLDFLFSALPTYANSPTGFTPPGTEGVTITSTSPATILLVQMTPEVARAVNGMDITTVQWESMGGMRLNFKVMCIQVPQIRSDFYGRCGICHGTTA